LQAEEVTLSKPPRRQAASLVGTLRPGRWRQNRAVAVPLVAALPRQKLCSSMLLAHRRQREADPPPGLAAWRKPHWKPRPGGGLRGDPRNRVGV